MPSLANLVNRGKVEIFLAKNPLRDILAGPRRI